MAGASWSVCATVHEPIEVLCAFVAHYLHLGAERVTLYLDQPNPQIVAALSSPGVRLVACDDTYWRAIGHRPAGQVARQESNARAAYSDCMTDWLLHCDADELLRPDRPVSEILGNCPTETDWLRVPVAERVYLAEESEPGDIFRGRLRFPLRPALARRVYGEDATFMPRGLTGHRIGKAISRAGRGLTLYNHWARPVGLNGTTVMRDAVLAHFDGFTSAHWLAKLVRHAQRVDRTAWSPEDPQSGVGNRSSGRDQQVAEILLTEDEPERRRALTRLKELSPAQARTLRRNRKLAPIRLDPAGAARLLFPELDLDYTEAGFDARLTRG